jgi:hypothetical protein
MLRGDRGLAGRAGPRIVGEGGGNVSPSPASIACTGLFGDRDLDDSGRLYGDGLERAIDCQRHKQREPVRPLKRQRLGIADNGPRLPQ